MTSMKYDMRVLNRIQRAVQKSMDDTSRIELDIEAYDMEPGALDGLKETHAALMALLTIKRIQAMSA